MFAFSLNSISQNIKTGTTGYNGNIYHTGGYLGIGTIEPQALLHLQIDHNTSSEYATIILQNIYPKSIKENYWDFRNEGHLYFDYSGNNEPTNTKMMIDSSGRLLLGTTPHDNSAILNLQSTTMGMLIPRMVKFQIDAIINPAQGLLVYATDENKFKYFDDTNWQTIPNSSQINSQLANYLLIDDFNNHPSSEVTQ